METILAWLPTILSVGTIFTAGMLYNRFTNVESLVKKHDDNDRKVLEAITKLSTQMEMLLKQK